MPMRSMNNMATIPIRSRSKTDAQKDIKNLLSNGTIDKEKFEMFYERRRED